MDNLSFEMLNQGWNAIRMSGAPNLRQIVAGLIDPSQVILQRIGETPETLTIMFKGFDQALENPETDAPVLKRALLAWVKNFAEAQIERTGDPMSFIVRIIKPQQQPAPVQMAAEARWQKIKEALIAGDSIRGIKGNTISLTNITQVRIRNGS